MLDLLSRPVPLLAAELTIADLKTIQDQLAAAKARLEQQSAIFHALMQRRFEDQARAEYARQKKETGSVRFAATNTLNLKVEIDKAVKWDQDRLPAILKKLGADDAAHLAKISYDISESKFNAAAPKLREALTAARTVAARPMKFTLVNSEPEDAAAAAAAPAKDKEAA